MSRGLFKRAILQSGVVLAPTWHFIPQTEASGYGTDMATNLNCSSVEDYLECLQSKTVEEIYQGDYGSRHRWMPTIDSTFLPDSPLEILQRGEIDHDIEVIVGSNADDGLLFVNNQTDFEDFRNNFDFNGPAWLFYMHEWEITEDYINKARQ